MFINLLYFNIQYVLYNCDIYIYISLCLSLYYLTIEINDRSIHYICIYGCVCMSVGVCVSMCVCVLPPEDRIYPRPRNRLSKTVLGFDELLQQRDPNIQWL